MTTLDEMPQHFDELIGRVHAVNPQPGDTVIIESSSALTPDQASQLSTDLKPHFPDNEILVLMDLKMRIASA